MTSTLRKTLALFIASAIMRYVFIEYAVTYPTASGGGFPIVVIAADSVAGSEGKLTNAES